MIRILLTDRYQGGTFLRA